MQETQWIDDQGRENIRRQFFTGKTEEELSQKLKAAYDEAVSALPNVVRITQERVSLEGQCPCGKDKPFRNCCYWKLLQSPPIAITRYKKG